MNNTATSTTLACTACSTRAGCTSLAGSGLGRRGVTGRSTVARAQLRGRTRNRALGGFVEGSFGGLGERGRAGRMAPTRATGSSSGNGEPEEEEEEDEFDEEDYCIFYEIDKQLVDFLTFKSLKIVLNQLQETDVSCGKSEYMWLYQFATENRPSAGDYFLQDLFKERPDYAERISTTRAVLFSRWHKAFRAERVYADIEDRNLSLMRERLLSTVNMALEVPEDLAERVSMDSMDEGESDIEAADVEETS